MKYPVWCCNYLERTATELHVLARLLDPRRFPERQPREPRSCTGAGSRIGAARRRSPLAMHGKLTAPALGLTRRGWNAFGRFHADAASKMAALDYEFPIGELPGQVFDRMVSQRGSADASSVRSHDAARAHTAGTTRAELVKGKTYLLGYAVEPARKRRQVSPVTVTFRLGTSGNAENHATTCPAS